MRSMHAGQMEYLDMFQAAYTAAIRHYKDGPWYPSADIWRGSHTQIQFTSLQAFWPGENILTFFEFKSRNSGFTLLLLPDEC